MKTPELPSDESVRLGTLRSLDILDTLPEERFDRLTRMARRLFGVPIALVSLVDAERQWFKSCVGLDATETPRDVSFCGHAIHGDDVFLVDDATKDERFADNPLVLDEPRIRFYAGCPLRAPNGSQMGTFCIIDYEPRTLDEDELETLRDLASMAERELSAVQMATLDELTGITNRCGFVMLGKHTLSLCRRQGIPAALVFFDLDDFKPVNDRFGHAEGDRALIAFAEQMKNTYRESDIFARLGGDEFVVLLTNTTSSVAESVVARFEWALQAHNQEEDRGYTLAFSYGIVDYDPERHLTLAALLDDGDALMYERKRVKK